MAEENIFSNSDNWDKRRKYFISTKFSKQKAKINLFANTYFTYQTFCVLFMCMYLFIDILFSPLNT